MKPILGASTDSCAEADAQTAFEEMLGDEKTSSEATRAELDKLSEYRLTLIRAAAHAQTKHVFARLGFVNINQSSNEYIQQYNAELTILVMGRGMHGSEELTQVKEEITTDGPSFEEQCTALQERMGKSKKPKVEIPANTTNCESHTMNRHSAAPATPSPARANIVLPADEPVSTGQSASRTTEPTPKDLKNRVALQRICLSQIKDGMNPMVPNQGIVFDENNHPWSLPPGDTGRKPPVTGNQWGSDDADQGQTSSRHDGDAGCSKHGRDGGDPGNNGGSDSSEDGDDPNKGVRDPFTPCFQSRGPSLAPTARSLEVKGQHTEQKFQQIIEFIHLHLEHKLTIPDGAKGTWLDTKTMRRYDGTASREVLWEWLRSVVFAYRMPQLGGPDCDEERVLILDLLLEGKAKTWFQQRISRPGMGRPLFVEVIIDLYSRFIHDSALQDARDTFRVTRWDEEDNTVQGWKDTLQQLIDDMDVAPDDYSVKNKFMIGLLPAIRNGVFADKLSVEYND